MPDLSSILLGILAPALITGAILAVAWRDPRASAEDPGRGRIAGAFAFGLSYLVAHWGIAGEIAVPSPERTLAAKDWIPWVVIFAMLLSALSSLKLLRRAQPQAGGGVALALLVLLSLKSQTTSLAGWAGVAVTFFLLEGGWALTEMLAQRTSGAGLPLALWVVASGAAYASLSTYSALTAQLAGALAASLGASLVVSWWNPRLCLHGGAVAVAMVVLGACLISGVFFGEMPRTSAFLLLLGACAPWLASSTRFTMLAPWKRALLRGALAAAPTAAAVVIASAADSGH